MIMANFALKRLAFLAFKYVIPTGLLRIQYMNE